MVEHTKVELWMLASCDVTALRVVSQVATIAGVGCSLSRPSADRFGIVEGPHSRSISASKFLCFSSKDAIVLDSKLVTRPAETG